MGIDSSIRASPGGSRALVFACLAVLTLASWAYLLYQDWAMAHMDIVDMAMPSTAAWGVADLTLVFMMWAIMMTGMMLPSAMPMVFAVEPISRQRGTAPFGASLLFTGGYLSSWMAFSVLATLVQWSLHSAALMSADMKASTPVLAGLLLAAAGLYQLSTVKLACLTRCRSPLDFLLTEWRDGRWGTFVMGLRHGAFCTGCCWGLMALLFALGVMNLAWVAVISVVVLLEKVTPRGVWLARGSGVLLIGWGAHVLLGGT
jgi:predicted metal-binding membrane protein